MQVLCSINLCRARVLHAHDGPSSCFWQDAQCTLWILRGCKISTGSEKWLRQYGGHRKILTKTCLSQACREAASALACKAHGGPSSDPPLRPCQAACLEACAKGARVIEMACGTGKTRVIRELTEKQSGKVALQSSAGVLLCRCMGLGILALEFRMS